MNGAGSRSRGRPVPAVSEIMGGRRFKLLPTNPTQLRLSSNYWAAFAEEANLGKTKLARLPEECNLLQHLRARDSGKRKEESWSAFLRARETRVEERERGSYLSLDVEGERSSPQGLNLIIERASNSVSGRRVGN